MSFFVSDIIPLKVGSTWQYRIEYKLFRRDVKMQVMDRKADYHLVKFQSGDNVWSAVFKSNVDLYVTGYSKKGVNTLGSNSEIQDISKTLVLKSPVVEGNTWQNNFGIFRIMSTDYRLKIGQKVVPSCIHLGLKDQSNADNDFFIKEGIGLVYASVYIDNLGAAKIILKKFSL